MLFEERLKPHLKAGQGKYNSKLTLLHPETTSIKLVCNIESRFLALDVDDPTHPNSEKLLNYIKSTGKDHFIVWSSEFKIDDVFAGNCRYKVIFDTNDDNKYISNLTFSRKNKAIEVFYCNNRWVAISGQRGDGYEYTYKGQIQPIGEFIVNDVLEHNVWRLQKENPKKHNPEEEVKNLETSGDVKETYEHPDTNELIQLLVKTGLVSSIPKMKLKKVQQGQIILFDCLFDSEEHTNKGNGWAKKIGNKWSCHCQSTVCQSRYIELNKKLKQYALEKEGVNYDKYKNLDIYPSYDEKVVIWEEPTGSGKTERLARHLIWCIINKRKALFLLPSKSSIDAFMNRVNEFSEGMVNDWVDANFISKYTLEEKDYLYKSRGYTTKQQIVDHYHDSVVIVSHHHYFIPAGDLLTYHEISWDILKRANQTVFVDESDTFIEKSVRKDLRIGGLYVNQEYSYNSSMKQNYKKLKKSDKEGKILTNVVLPELNTFGLLEYRKKSPIYKNLNYVDLLDGLVDKFELVDERQIENNHYKIYKNKYIVDPKPNNIENMADCKHLVFESANHVIITINVGDDIPRANKGNVDVSVLHTKIFKNMFDKSSQLFFITATFSKFHEYMIHKVCDEKTKHIKVSRKIDKVKNITLIKAREEASKFDTRKNVIQCLEHHDFHSLMFVGTKYDAGNILRAYPTTMLKTVDHYQTSHLGDRKGVPLFDKHIVLIALESGSARGDNLFHEVSDWAEGFNVIYFDTSPVSNNLYKMYVDDNDELMSYKEDNHKNKMKQAIGRIFRKEKKEVLIVFNKIKKSEYAGIKEFLENETTANVTEQDLSIWTQTGELQAKLIKNGTK